MTRAGVYRPDWYLLQPRKRRRLRPGMRRSWAVWKPWVAAVILPEGDPRRFIPAERYWTEAEAKARAIEMAHEAAAGGRGRVEVP